MSQSVCVCVLRSRLVGIYCVTGSWSSSAFGPGYWESDVLYKETTTHQEVQRFLSFSLCSIIVSYACSSCVYFFTDASSLPQASPTQGFGRAAHKAAPASRPHTSASLYLWSPQPLKPVNFCPLHLPDHTLEHRSPAGQLHRSVSSHHVTYWIRNQL